MQHLKTLVLMQLKDKIDLKIIKDRKNLLRLIVFSSLKFIIITAFSFVLLLLCSKFGIFFYSESPKIMVLVVSFSLLLSLISCTLQLMKNLYFSEDNKVLITFPVNANIIFISKLVCYYLYEIKRSFNFLIPITLSCVMLLINMKCCDFGILFWMWIPLLFIISLPVLLGAILSIPTMYIYRFLKKYSILEVIISFAVLSFGVYGVIYLINLIPENIDLMNQWPTISKYISNFLKNFESSLVLMRNLISIIIGEEANIHWGFTLTTLLKFMILIATIAVLIVISYFASRPIFFKMMSKSFELNKSSSHNKENIKHNKYFTFVNKEFIINIRTLNISLNYLIVYIAIPIMILLLNALYKAMDTKELGNLLIYTFNILLICLPLLVSNSIVATYYSSEGRAGYMKKTKPVHIVYPLLAKLAFNAVFSIPIVFITTFVFGRSNLFTNGEIVLLGFAILLLHFGHMIWSAMLDIMNPQNEQYETTKIVNDNPNENKSTALAFIISFLYAIISYKLLSESSLNYQNMYMGFSKLLMISIVFFISCLYLFIRRIKAYYFELQGDR